MSRSELSRAEARQLIIDTLRQPDFQRAKFGGMVRQPGACPWQRVVVRPIELRGERHLQFAYYDTKKNITKNVRGADLAAPLDELLQADFAGLHLTTSTQEIDLRTTKKGKILIGRGTTSDAARTPDLTHNRTKDVPLPEGQANRLLTIMGILSPTGQVRPTMRAKFTQINEFLKLLGHVLADARLDRLDRPVEILDCGCGSSYLTLAAHHYLNEVRHIPARVLGVDVNDDLIRKSSARAARLGAPQLNFTCGGIGTVDASPDIVLALHACDTATDDAIAQAIRAQARLLLCVPCCHHHLNEQVRAEGPAEVLRPILRHGILHERTADLVTDALRALILRIMGYRAEVIEFISPEHTARNLMIRALRQANPGNARYLDEYRAMKAFWGVTPYLESLLGDSFQHRLTVEG